MNERIRELAEQAGYKPLSPPTFADELNEIFMRKFAELIVRECANQCLSDDSMRILNHMGVKAEES
jgi:hypothetical protein